MISRSALLALRTANLTYEEVGSTRGALPTGYHHVDRRRIVGQGQGAFDAAAQALVQWELQRRTGLTVVAEADRAAQDINLILGIGIGRLRLRAPCRVVYLVDEPEHRGFAYGTLPGHPESGEERFTVELLPDGRVELTILAFSKPAMWWSRVGGPVNRLAQSVVTARYLRALGQ